MTVLKKVKVWEAGGVCESWAVEERTDNICGGGER